jgi:hypothetical protein
MEKAMGVLLIVILGLGGTGAAVLAWLFPALNIDRTEAALAGLIGLGFAVFQGLRFRHSSPSAAEPVPVEIRTEKDS